jgi:chemotaxis signal transduction protein
MNSDEIVEELESLDAEEVKQETVAERTERFFVFAIGESLFAVRPSEVHELVAGVEVYKIPCCPAYVAGLINSHGAPFTVIDLKILLENERQDATMFLVLNRKDDSVAFACTDASEICDIPESAISAFPADNPDAPFYESRFTLGEKQVFLLSVNGILRKLSNDLVS